MSERMKRHVEKTRKMQDFKHTFPELLEGLEILSSEVDALQRCLERVIAPAKIGAPARADDWTDPYAEVVRRCQKAEADADAWRTAAESALRELQDAVQTFFHAHTHTVAAGHGLVPDQDMADLKAAFDKFNHHP
jgi:hypothetical protein